MKKFIALFTLLIGFCFISEVQPMAFQRFNEEVDALQAILDHEGPLAPYQQAQLDGIRNGNLGFLPLDDESIRLDQYVRRGNGEANPVPRLLADINPGLHGMLAQADARYPRAAGADRSPRRRPVAAAPVVPAEENFIQKHPYYTAAIVVGGVTVIVLAVDAAVRGKKSLVGRLFYAQEADDATFVVTEEAVVPIAE